MRMIARRLGLAVKTVRRYLRVDSVEQFVAGGVRTSKLDPFKPYLHQRLKAAVRGATAPHAEIVEQGYTRQLQHCRALPAAVAPQRRGHRRPGAGEPTAAGAAGHRLDPRPAMPGHLDIADEARMEAIRGRCPGINAAVGHVAGFARMSKDLSGDKDRLTT